MSSGCGHLGEGDVCWPCHDRWMEENGLAECRECGKESPVEDLDVDLLCPRCAEAERKFLAEEAAWAAGYALGHTCTLGRRDRSPDARNPVG